MRVSQSGCVQYVLYVCMCVHVHISLVTICFVHCTLFLDIIVLGLKHQFCYLSILKASAMACCHNNLTGGWSCIQNFNLVMSQSSVAKCFRLSFSAYGIDICVWYVICMSVIVFVCGTAMCIYSGFVYCVFVGKLSHCGLITCVYLPCLLQGGVIKSPHLVYFFLQTGITVSIPEGREERRGRKALTRHLTLCV